MPFYDVNALSNFVADAPNVIGFNPYVDLADLIIERITRRCSTGDAECDERLATGCIDRVDTMRAWLKRR